MLKTFSYRVILLIRIKPLCGKGLRLDNLFKFEKMLKKRKIIVDLNTSQ